MCGTVVSLVFGIRPSPYTHCHKNDFFHLFHYFFYCIKLQCTHIALNICVREFRRVLYVKANGRVGAIPTQRVYQLSDNVAVAAYCQVGY